jgi:hypothetical protein
MSGKGKSRPVSGSPKQPDGARIPRVEVVTPLEGRPAVRLICSTYEEELRLRAELERWRAAA